MRNKLFFIYAACVLLGALTGLIGSLFQLAIQQTDYLLSKFYSFANGFGIPIGLISALISMLMVYLAFLMVKRISPESSGSGVQEIEGALLHRRPMNWRRVLPVKFFGGILAIASKMVVGREGPTIQMGGSLGAMLGEWLFSKQERRDILIAAGSAAGLATAFNAPLAGVLFVLEEMRSEFRFNFTHFQAVAICCVVATMVLHLILGNAPSIPMDVYEMPSLKSLCLFFVFGILVGFVGLLFNLVLIESLRRTDQWSESLKKRFVLCVGALVGYLAYVHPGLVGGGYGIIEEALTMRPTWDLLTLILIIRFVMTMLSYNTGIPGGVFAPLLALGTVLGVASSYLLQYIMVDETIHPGMFAIAGMGALFAAAVRAPVTGIVLVVEMTQNYSLILPLMVTCLTSTTVMQWAKNPPIYAQLLRRTLKKQDSQPTEGVKKS